MVRTKKSSPHAAGQPPVVLVLQGGGALGAYQAGVYEGLHDAGLAPDWIAGISIGAFNTAIIAGNPPERRIDALREFWETISQPSFLPPTLPPGLGDQPQFDTTTRSWLDAWEAMRALVEGQAGFYAAHVDAAGPVPAAGHRARELVRHHADAAHARAPGRFRSPQ